MNNMTSGRGSEPRALAQPLAVQMKRAKSLWFCTLMVAASAVSCQQQTEKAMPVDPYYIRIQGVPLRIPAGHLVASEIAHRKHAAEADRMARRPPGWDVGEIFMILDPTTLAPMTEAQASAHPRPPQMDVRLPGRQPNPDIARPLPANWVRNPKADAYGLQAYRDTNERPDASTKPEWLDRHYFAAAESSTLVRVVCTGFALPNPRCQLSAMWHGLRLVYWFDHTELPSWRSIHGRLLAKLDSFLIQ